MKFLKKLESRFLLAPKLIYLVVNLQFYGFHQLRFAFAKDKFGVSEENYGKFTGYTQFLTFFSNILIGNFSDRTKKYKPILISLIIISTVVFLHFYINALMSLHSLVFWVFILLYLMFNNPKAPLLDKIMIEYLECFSEVGSKIYGKQRLWGTIALSLATYLCEWCTADGDGAFDFDYLIHYNVIITILAALCVTLFVRTGTNSVQANGNDNKNVVLEQENTHNKHKETQNSFSKYAAFMELFRNKEFMFFILIIFSNAVTRSALTIYLSMFHKDILKIKPYDLPEHWPAGIKSLVNVFNSKPIGTLTTFGIVFEMAVMFVADKILDRLGYFWPLILAQVVSMVRFLAYYLISSSNEHVYGLSCLFELLRGVYFGMIHISSVHIAPKLAPPHLKATSQMMYQGTFAAMGSLVSGYLFGDMFKSRLTKDSAPEERENVYKLIFLINFGISLATVAICFIKYGLIDRVLFSRERENRKLNSYELQQAVENEAQ
ncbi:uncharacterized protein VICG_01134 [Vittaforma corneae ATCC 50505]|uniref:Major facilitator superfamily associated domain-containing protein n=1 Tax=Vittaforma corneae (strain ATCC 50505) TaxID=993615 RepID=L2GN94_VITCO|nr:uncharacterized protein VICG_01134 [Vittaforma corneae ATCC 50505]ELA41782.1 hypothetical protein VICG_01134 [Vittaforma corneae ATCC 50505]